MQVIRTYLQLTTPGDFRPSPARPPPLASPTTPAALDVQLVPDPTPALYRHLYRTVGAAYHWRDRWDWSDADIRRHLGQREITLYLARTGAATVGWYELRRVREDASVEIAYFGLMPEAIGRGYGRSLLAAAVSDAWDLGATRVWLHTCTLDHPHAVANYKARGFREYKSEVYEVDA
jgi:ribosomal protein S18 acetylase RimI-like enzyme